MAAAFFTRGPKDTVNLLPRRFREPALPHRLDFGPDEAVWAKAFELQPVAAIE